MPITFSLKIQSSDRQRTIFGRRAHPERAKLASSAKQCKA